jgi:hypothetical protein
LFELLPITVPMRDSSLRILARGKFVVASVAALSINVSIPAFCALMFAAPPRMKRPAATVKLPSRRFNRTFRPLTSNSLTSAACFATTL